MIILFIYVLTGLLIILCDGVISLSWPQMASDCTNHEKLHNLWRIAQFLRNKPKNLKYTLFFWKNLMVSFLKWFTFGNQQTLFYLKELHIGMYNANNRLLLPSCGMRIADMCQHKWNAVLPCSCCNPNPNLFQIQMWKKLFNG